MLNKYINRTYAVKRMESSYLGNILVDFAVYLDEKGYSINTIQISLWSVEHFSRWLKSKKIPSIEINKLFVDKFLKQHLTKCRCPRPALSNSNKLRASLYKLLRMLNVWDEHSGRHTNIEIENLINEFDNYLNNICGIAKSTRVYRCRFTRDFLVSVFRKQSLSFKYLTPKIVDDYVCEYSKHMKTASIGVLTGSLRSFFKYLKFNGDCNDSLINAIPKIPNWKLSSIPKYLHQSEINKFLSTFNQSIPIGKRNYAIARCMTDLGLRCIEVANLQLEDVNWRNGTIEIRKGKNHRVDILPLPKTLAKALINYLQNGRPSIRGRYIFAIHLAPWGRGITTATIRHVIRRAYARAGLKTEVTGTHILRKTVATHMLQRGATLKDIADVLRHRCIDTTMIYTKVDITHLSQVALPWPRRTS